MDDMNSKGSQPRKVFELAVLLLILLSAFAGLTFIGTANAQTTNLTVTIKSWDITGIDNNFPETTGTNATALEIRICNTGNVTATNVTATFAWNDNNSDYIYLHPHETLNKTLGTIAPGVCKDAFWVVRINRSTPMPPNSADPIYRNYTVNVTSSNSNSTNVSDTIRLKKLQDVGENDIVFIDYYPKIITVCTNFNVTCSILIKNINLNCSFPIDFDPSFVELVNFSINISGVIYNTTYIPGGIAAKGQPYNMTYTFHAIAPGITSLLPMMVEFRGTGGAIINMLKVRVFRTSLFGTCVSAITSGKIGTLMVYRMQMSQVSQMLPLTCITTATGLILEIPRRMPLASICSA